MTLALLITAAAGAWAQDGIQAITIAQFLEAPVSDTKYELTGTVENIVETTYGNFDLSDDNGKKVYIYGLLTSEGTSKQFASMGIKEGDNITIIATRSEYQGEPQAKNAILKSINPKGPKVTINDAKTEASFEMPTSDVTIDYELVRDIATGVKALVNNGAECIYVTKVEDKFVPKEAITYKLTDVLDQNNQFDLVEGTDYEKVGMHILDGDTWKDVTDESDLKPGTYEMIFKGLGKYDGKVYSQEFLLSNGYELTIAAGEYATFYHNEKLRIEDTDAELYTIANVTATEAVLSEKMEVAPAETPLLVYNAGSETKTFLLIPTDDEASEVLVAAEFRGTLAAKDMPASSSTMDYYVCTGKAFTWVRDAGQIAANRCWLQIGSGNQPANTRSSSRAITRGIGGIDGTTGIDAIDNEQFANDTYYDLQGRKVQNPKRGGIYIHNGKKVIKH